MSTAVNEKNLDKAAQQGNTAVQARKRATDRARSSGAVRRRANSES